MADITPPTTDTRPLFETVTLAQPIVRGETTIDTLTLRRPKTGELRGLALADLINTDVVALLKLLPRVSEPCLTDQECADLDPQDFAEIGGTLRGFFMTSGERMVLEAMIAEHQPKT